MGFLDRMIKQGLSDAIGGAIGGKVTEAMEKATGIDLDNDGQAGRVSSPYGSPTQTYPAPGQQKAYAPPASAPASAPVTQATDKAYFRAIIQDCFSNYIIREDVPVSELGGEGKPYDFALFNHGECCGVVTLVAHNRDNNRYYKGAKAAAAANGVPFINFYTHMPNERGFVINRIKRLVKP